MDLDISEEKRKNMRDFFMQNVNTRSEVAYLFDLGELKLIEIENQNNGVKHDEVGLSTLGDKNYSSAPGEEGVTSWYTEESDGGTHSEETTTEGHIQRGPPRRDTLRGEYHGGTHSEGPTTEGQSWEESTTEGIMGLGHLPKHLATPGADSVIVPSRHLNMANPPHAGNGTVEGAHEANCQIRVVQRVPEGVRRAKESYTVRATPRDMSVCGPGSGRHRVDPRAEPRKGGVAQVEGYSPYEPQLSEQRDEQDRGGVSGDIQRGPHEPQIPVGDGPFRIQAVLDPAPTVIKEVVVSHDSDRPVKSLTCKVCKETFSFKSSLSRHMKTHNINKIPTYACELCGTQYTRRDKLTKHMKSAHSGTFIACTSCQRQFRTELGLKSHMKECKKQNCEKRSPNESVYKCDVCQKCFWTKISLSKHKQFHTKPGDKPFQCCKCGKQFSYSGRKSAHEKDCKVIKSTSLLSRHDGFQQPPNQHQHQQQSPHVGNRLNSEVRLQDVSDSSQLIESHQGALSENQFSTLGNFTSTHWGGDVSYHQYNHHNGFNYNDNVSSYYHSGNIASDQNFNTAYEHMQQGYYASRPDYYNTNVYMSEHYPHGVNFSETKHV